MNTLDWSNYINQGPMHSGKGYMSAKAFSRHARRTFPFTNASPRDLDRAMLNLKTEQKIARDLMFIGLRRGDQKEVRLRRKRLDAVNAAIRNGEWFARATGWPFKQAAREEVQ